MAPPPRRRSAGVCAFAARNPAVRLVPMTARQVPPVISGTGPMSPTISALFDAPSNPPNLSSASATSASA